MEVVRTIMPGSRQFQKHCGDNPVAVEREQSHPDISLNAVHSCCPGRTQQGS
ncbi:Uncharacterised protein [Halioglobus japonicus]|nr:Uncharacterised protein [Halioglobus japonicus]